jgi:hypothetical protein
MILKKFILLISIATFIFSCKSANNDLKTVVDTPAIQSQPVLTKEQSDSLFLQELSPLFGKKLFRKGYLATKNSYPDDIQNTINGPFRYAGSIEQSEVVLTIYKDKTCEIIFKPIGHKQVVSKIVNWEIGDNNTLNLSEDVFAKIEVTSADFPLSEDPFYDYILIMKNIKFGNNEIIIEERNTSRRNFFVQLAIAEQSGEAKSDIQYAMKLMREMTFDYQMVTSYIGYYSF